MPVLVQSVEIACAFRKARGQPPGSNGKQRNILDKETGSAGTLRVIERRCRTAREDSWK